MTGFQAYQRAFKLLLEDAEREFSARELDELLSFLASLVHAKRIA